MSQRLGVDYRSRDSRKCFFENASLIEARKKKKEMGSLRQMKREGERA